MNYWSGFGILDFGPDTKSTPLFNYYLFSKVLLYIFVNLYSYLILSLEMYVFLVSLVLRSRGLISLYTLEI